MYIYIYVCVYVCVCVYVRACVCQNMTCHAKPCDESRIT